MVFANARRGFLCEALDRQATRLRSAVSLALVALPVFAQPAESPQPILDVHLHLSMPEAFRRPAPRFCPGAGGELISPSDAKRKTADSQFADCAGRSSPRTQMKS